MNLILAKPAIKAHLAKNLSFLFIMNIVNMSGTISIALVSS